MRAFAADDYDAIRARISQIKEAEKPRCPVHTHLALHACLRTTARCLTDCPHASEWIGPSSEDPA